MPDVSSVGTVKLSDYSFGTFEWNYSIVLINVAMLWSWVLFTVGGQLILIY